MFVCSVKSPRSKVIAAVIVILLILLGFIVCSQLPGGSGGWPSGTTEPQSDTLQTDAAVSYNAADASERLAFIAQFGWQVKEEPAEISEVIIPTDFDEVYEKYNALQKAQGLDLESYQGERVKRWSYTVTNYPNAENTDYIRINLLICDGVVIGGDVCSLAENGFMHGFSAESTSGENNSGS